MPEGAWLVEQTDGFRIGARWHPRQAAIAQVLMLCAPATLILVSVHQRGQITLQAAFISLLATVMFGFRSVPELIKALSSDEVEVVGDKATIRSGFGRWASCEAFQWSEIVRVELRIFDEDQRTGDIVLDGEKPHTLGSTLKAEQREFVARALSRKVEEGKVARGQVPYRA
jgi:hypothetical protein